MVFSTSARKGICMICGHLLKALIPPCFSECNIDFETKSKELLSTHLCSRTPKQSFNQRLKVNVWSPVYVLGFFFVKFGFRVAELGLVFS